ncbi:ferredoxin [Sulfitobacter sp. HNIBRBA2951]|uniref:ferredoxin n=1 Tax=Sulfitobacter aquimarinus TaxID=3158557 RepID=UPI0032DF335A
MGHLPHPETPAHTIILVGADRDFWDVFTSTVEYSDGAPDPVDRMSKRILGAAATALGGTAQYPSDGPPYAPFIAWAQGTGRFWQSPTGMLVHDVAGLMISIRGALIVPYTLPTQAVGEGPCVTCADRPCVGACPVDALSDQHFYDVPTCRAHIASEAGRACMTTGCATRLACPISQRFDRPHAQSAFHMRSFAGA